jgi:hypothetical protein
MKYLPFVALIQMILHYLGVIGIFLGIIACLFGNFSRGFELIIGGAVFIGIKYLIGMIFVLLAKILGRPKKTDNPLN